MNPSDRKSKDQATSQPRVSLSTCNEHAYAVISKFPRCLASSTSEFGAQLDARIYIPIRYSHMVGKGKPACSIVGGIKRLVPGSRSILLQAKLAEDGELVGGGALATTLEHHSSRKTAA